MERYRRDIEKNGSDTDDPYRSYRCRRLTEGAGRLLTRTRHFGLTATVAAALSTPPSTTRASWTRGRKGGGFCSSIKDKEDDDDKDDDQDTKKQHSIKWRHLWRRKRPHTPLCWNGYKFTLICKISLQDGVNSSHLYWRGGKGVKENRRFSTSETKCPPTA